MAHSTPVPSNPRSSSQEEVSTRVLESTRKPASFAESEREETCASLPRVMSSLLGTFCIQHGRKRMKKAEGPRVTSQDPDTSAENTDKPLINSEKQTLEMLEMLERRLRTTQRECKYTLP